MLPVLGWFFMSSPCALTLGKLLPEKSKPGYEDALGTTAHPLTSLFPHVVPSELFVWLGVAAGVKALGLPVTSLALRDYHRVPVPAAQQTGECTMMIYCARITAIGLFVADGLTNKMLITFDSNGPKDCLDYSLSLEPSFREESLMILPGDRLMLAGHDYLVTAVGKGAQQALFELGHLTLVFNGDLNPCHVVHLSGPVPNLHDLHGNLVIEEGRP